MQNLRRVRHATAHRPLYVIYAHREHTSRLVHYHTPTSSVQYKQPPCHLRVHLCLHPIQQSHTKPQHTDASRSPLFRLPTCTSTPDRSIFTRSPSTPVDSSLSVALHAPMVSASPVFQASHSQSQETLHKLLQPGASRKSPPSMLTKRGLGMNPKAA